MPIKHRLLFNDFIISKRQDGRKVLFDINFEAFAAKMQSVVPVLKSAMSEERRLDIEEKEMLAHEKAEKFKIRQMTAVLEARDEEEAWSDVDEMKDYEPEFVDLTEGKRASDEPIQLVRATDDGKAANQLIRIYSHTPANPLKEKVLAELNRFKLKSETLDVDNLTAQLSSCRCVIMIVENVQEMDRHARKQATATLTKIVQAARTASPRTRVIPVFETQHFLDLSKMYSLARSEFFYFVDGVGKARSMTELILQLRSYTGR